MIGEVKVYLTEYKGKDLEKKEIVLRQYRWVGELYAKWN